MKMKGYLRLFLALLVGKFAFVEADQQGFISLDCGLPTKESPYTERKTGLIFSSDSEFIQTGERGRVADSDLQKFEPHNGLRYFPNGMRHCYNLRVEPGTLYLVRAGFLYGNYDGRKTTPRFDLSIGPNIWTVVEAQDLQEEEMIHMQKSNSLQICLLKTGPTTPFISTLELRPLRDGSYNAQTASLKLLERRSYYSVLNPAIRYPDDVYDRIWPAGNSIGDIGINTTLHVDSSNPFQLPQVLLRWAYTPETASERFLSWYYGDNPTDLLHSYLHFAEIQTLKANDTREFNIVVDLNITNAAYNPKKLQLDTVFNIAPLGSSLFWLEKTRRSTLPPLLNAYEMFTVMEFPYSETNPDDVAALKAIQGTYGLNIISWQGDPCVPEQFKWEDLECNYTNNSVPPRIISLDLSSRGLRGIIAPALQNLTELRKLDLSSNSLSGEVPEFLASMKSLSIINLSWNNLKGLVPQNLLDRAKNGLITLSIEGNPKICQDDKCKKNYRNFLVPVIASIVSLVLFIVVIVLIYVSKKKRKLKVRHRSPITKSAILTKKRRFTYSEVESMTSNFERVIGEGGFGVVYHGSLSDIQQVAVKVLSQSSTQGYKQFKAEVELLLRVHHVNLVSLVGYCIEEDHLALVYEYAANGDLKRHLLGESHGAVLNWSCRLRISTEIAQGLEYLHIGCEPPMVHRDVKTTNILLDEKFQAKLADFGLSKSFPIGVETQVSTNVVGTPGYLDPEYYRTNWLNEKSDVYSFGIVLLEMITNQPVIQKAREKSHIAEWVGFMLTKGDIENIMDPNLNGDYDSSSVWRALELAMSCTNPSSAERLNMSQVVSELKECLIYENLKKETRSDIEPENSLEVRTNFPIEITPAAR